ncbi:uncharacterized protein LOC104582111 [Brachypodium distachyon]|uniref:uncharacterized protein LOC104582111 n=1 Tax=Brachypodium distachyon TaxID=15368 RepID=UPI00052FDC33|nr:uncharacterized protein LOC104582111 [Brachypodium distachyon]|eukprot:XP_010229748.1 uncharacterized protein LOC104582111 [Brachypodium distachyon]
MPPHPYAFPMALSRSSRRTLLQEGNYDLWRILFCKVFGKFSVADHIVVTADPLHHPDPKWIQDDFTIVSWLYTTVSSDVLCLIIVPQDSARAVWLKIEELFLDNQTTRTVYLDAEFHNLQQGNMNVTEYCTRLKTLPDSLRNLGKPVSDAELVHSTLHGLHRDLQHLIPILTREVPLPSFWNVRLFLLSEETRLAKADAAPTSTVFHATTTSAPAPLVAAPSIPAPPKPKSKDKGKSKQKQQPAPAQPVYAPASSGYAPAPAFGVHPSAARPDAPWTGMVHVWPVPWRPHYPGAGILGPRPHGAPPAPSPAPAPSAFAG